MLLIMSCQHDLDFYIHRSGRTGRAAYTGIAVMIYDEHRMKCMESN